MVCRLPASNERRRAGTSTNWGRLGQGKRYQFLVGKGKTEFVLRCKKFDHQKTQENRYPNCSNSSHRGGPGRREKIQRRCCLGSAAILRVGIAVQGEPVGYVFPLPPSAPQCLCIKSASQSRQPNTQAAPHSHEGGETEQRLRLLQAE